MDLSIIIINSRMEDKLKLCINSLIKTQRNKDYEIIVVNQQKGLNANSTIPNDFPFIRLIPCPKFGVAMMRNIGIRNSRGDYLLMLDADTEVLDDLTDLITFMREHFDAAAVGVKLLSKDYALQFSCRTFYDLRTIIFRRTFLGKLFPNHPIIERHLMLNWDHNCVRKVDWVQGAFFLMRKEAIDDVGLFDEFSPFGFEDVAWCWRAKKKNWNIYYFPAVRVIHHYQRTSHSLMSKRSFEHFIAFLKFSLTYEFPKI